MTAQLRITHDPDLGPIVELDGQPVRGLKHFEVIGRGPCNTVEVRLTVHAEADIDVPAEVVQVPPA